MDRRSAFFALFTLFCLTHASMSVAATNKALLIGVEGYEKAPPLKFAVFP